MQSLHTQCQTLTLQGSTWHVMLLSSITVQKFGLSRNSHYYSFKIFPRLWLVKTTRIIDHNQLLLTKYFTYDVKSAARCRLLKFTEETWGRGCVIFGDQPQKQRAKWRNSFKNGEIFWINNKAIIECGFRRSVDNTFLDLQNPSYPSQPHSIIANCSNRDWKKLVSRHVTGCARNGWLFATLRSESFL